MAIIFESNILNPKSIKFMALPRDFVQIESCVQEHLKSSTFSNISKWTTKSWRKTHLQILFRIFQRARQRTTNFCSMANLEMFRTAESNWLEAVDLAKKENRIKHLERLSNAPNNSYHWSAIKFYQNFNYFNQKNDQIPPNTIPDTDEIFSTHDIHYN